MVTTCEIINQKQIFSNDAQFISTGAIDDVVQVVNSTTETVLVSETIYANTLTSTSTHFRVTLAGLISANAGSDCTFTLRYGTTDILEVATVTLADEDDKQFKLVYDGRIHTVGASGKIVAAGRIDIEQGTPLMFANTTATAGVAVDLTAAGSINVTAKFDAAHADTDLVVMIGYIEFFN